MSDLVGNPEDRFSHNEAQLKVVLCTLLYPHHMIYVQILREKKHCQAFYYANTPMQHTAIFYGCKNDNFHMKIFGIFLIFALNMD